MNEAHDLASKRAAVNELSRHTIAGNIQEEQQKVNLIANGSIFSLLSAGLVGTLATANPVPILGATAGTLGVAGWATVKSFSLDRQAKKAGLVWEWDENNEHKVWQDPDALKTAKRSKSKETPDFLPPQQLEAGA